MFCNTLNISIQYLSDIRPEAGPPKIGLISVMAMYPKKFLNKLTNGTKIGQKVAFKPIWPYIRWPFNRYALYLRTHPLNLCKLMPFIFVRAIIAHCKLCFIPAAGCSTQWCQGPGDSSTILPFEGAFVLCPFDLDSVPLVLLVITV